MLTYERLVELLRSHENQVDFVWRVGRGKMRAGSIAGGLHKGNGRWHIMLDGKRYLRSRLRWLYETGKWPKDQIDHENHIRRDDGIENLREATNAENSRNRSKYNNNTSGVTGVCWRKSSKKWIACIWVSGGDKFLGCFDDFEEAVTARKAAEKKYRYHENHGK